MVNDTSEEQRAADIKRSDPCRPFERVRFPIGGAQCHNTWNIEGTGAHKGQSLSPADQARHEFPATDYEAYSLGEDWSSDWGVSDFKSSSTWEELHESHSSSSSDYDSWDSGDTDWDSDW